MGHDGQAAAGRCLAATGGLGFCPDCTAALSDVTRGRPFPSPCPPPADLDDLVGRLEPGRPIPAVALDLALNRPGLGQEIAAAVDAGQLVIVSEPRGPLTAGARPWGLAERRKR